MICIVILFINTLIKSITGNGFIEEPVLLMIAGYLEVMITSIALILYQTIIGKGLL